MPVLVISNGADDACTPSHAQRLFDAVRHADKTFHESPGANHYYLGPDQRPHLAASVGHCGAWLAAHGWT